MVSHARRWVLVGCTIFLVGFHGCCVSCSDSQNGDGDEVGFSSDGPAGIPGTLDAFRDQHDPPHRVVSVETTVIEPSEDRFSLGCGHAGPLCLVMIPLMALPQQPTEFHVGEVHQDGALTQRALYGTRERLTTGRFVEGQTVRYAGTLELGGILERPVIELGQAELDAEGEEGPTERTPILSQLDFVERYLDAFDEAAEARFESIRDTNRNRLAIELVSVLGPEVPALIGAWVVELPRSEVALTWLVRRVCARTPAVNQLPRADRAAAVRALGNEPPPALANEALNCDDQNFFPDPDPTSEAGPE